MVSKYTRRLIDAVEREAEVSSIIANLGGSHIYYIFLLAEGAKCYEGK